jgi:NAD-dependent deacetylase
MKKIVVLTGAGISAESGLKTFRDAGGLWEGHDVTQVATPEAWEADFELVLEFYNQRRKQAMDAKPNPGHLALAELESHFDVTVITQNIDALHERAGSSRVIHLHGEIAKSRSTDDPSLVYEIEGWELAKGDLCEKGSQLRPHVVWFGEPVPMMEKAMQETIEADILIVAGTSLVVYPAASLIHYVSENAPIFIIDPVRPAVQASEQFFFIEEPASTGLPKLNDQLIKQHA